MKSGDLVTLLLASANRDEKRYPHPDTVDLSAKNQRDHLTFFAGQRACVGQGLARAELFEATRQLLDLFPTIRFQNDSTEGIVYSGLRFRRIEPIKVQFR